MATYASKLRKEALDNATIRLNAAGKVSAGGIMEPFSAGTKGGAPAVFYVDGNVVSSGNGLSWLSAVKTLAEGLAMAHAYMSTSGNRAWAHRSTVFCCGDSFTEDLVILAEKTDVIGVGSCNGLDKPTLIGNHVPVTTNCWGCRFINWQFSEVDSGAMWTLTSVSNGIKFINCTFSVRGALATHGVLWTNTFDLEIRDCLFDGFPSGFTTGAIVIGAGLSDKIIIRDNHILASIGIVVNGSYTQVAGELIIDNNFIHASTLTIDDDSDLALISNNVLFSAAACGATGGTITNCIDTTDPKCCNNFLSGSDGNVMLPGTDMEW